MNKDIKQALNKIPTGWNDVTVEQFNLLINNLPNETEATGDEFENIDSSLEVISILSGLEISLLEQLSIPDILPVINKIQFVYTTPEAAKIGYKSKDIQELNYDEFIQFMQLKDDLFNNLNQILPIFFPELKATDVNKLPITVAQGCFFLLQRQLKKSLNSSVISLSLKVVKQSLMKMVQRKERA